MYNFTGVLKNFLFFVFKDNLSDRGKLNILYIFKVMTAAKAQSHVLDNTQCFEVKINIQQFIFLNMIYLMIFIAKDIFYLKTIPVI